MRETHYATLGREDRVFTFDAVELRADDEDALTFDGVASFADTAYTVRDAFGEFEETLHKGAFTKTIKERDDVALLVNHEGIPMARTHSGTLTLSANPHLRATAPLDPASPLVQTVASAMRRGDLNEMSIGFRAIRQEWNEDYTKRDIFEAQLFDVSIVTRSMNRQKDVAALRSLDELMHLTEADPDELRRAIAHLTSLLPPDEERTPLPVWADLEYQLLAKRHIAA